MLRVTFLLAILAVAGLAQVATKPTYCFGMLMTAPNRPNIPNEEAQKIQAAHMAHLTALADKGWLVAAGPMLTPGNLRGLAISKCQSVQEAIDFGNADPAVKQGRLTVQVYAWNAPEGLGDRYRQESKQPGYKMRMSKHPVAMLAKTAQWKGMPAMDVLKPHGMYVQSLMKDGKLKSAGPFSSDGDKMGVFIFASMPVEEAKLLAEADPLVKSGLVRVEMLEWFAADGTFPN